MWRTKRSNSWSAQSRKPAIRGALCLRGNSVPQQLPALSPTASPPTFRLFTRALTVQAPPTPLLPAPTFYDRARLRPSPSPPLPSSGLTGFLRNTLREGPAFQAAPLPGPHPFKEAPSVAPSFLALPSPFFRMIPFSLSP